jgi:hypothetical protein
VGAEFAVNAFTTASQSMPSVASARSGEFVVAWSGTGATDADGVFARRFGASGTPLGGDFRVNAYTTGLQYLAVAAADAAGNSTLAWTSDGQDGSGGGVFGRRFGADGVPRGAEFQVNTTTAGAQTSPAIAADDDGNFVVVWIGDDGAAGFDVYAQLFASDGARRGGEFRVNANTTGLQLFPAVTSDAAGNFFVTWDDSPSGLKGQRFASAGTRIGAEMLITPSASLSSLPDVAYQPNGDLWVGWTATDVDAQGVLGRRFDASGSSLGAEFAVNTYTTGAQSSPRIAVGREGHVLVVWQSEGQDGQEAGVFGRAFGGVAPASLSVDSGGNRVLDPGEPAEVAPAWQNLTAGVATFSGAASAFQGPPGPTYTVLDAAADYGTVPAGATGSCSATNDCFAVIVSALNRPAQHWDATLLETVAPAAYGIRKTWTLHIGASFQDVSSNSPYYSFIETLLHRDVTGGCAAGRYCPTLALAREQMSVFTLLAKDGSAYVPPPCGTPVFGDVPATSPFCSWIEELARRGVVAGCGGGQFCPTLPVTRETMAVMMLATREAPGYAPPPCGSPAFADVPASSVYCPWIEELARRGVVTGCGAGRYCPLDHVTREQMAVFVAATFGLVLYGA